MEERNISKDSNVHIDDLIDTLNVSEQWREKFKAFNAIFYTNYQDGNVSVKRFWEQSPEFKALSKEDKMKFSPTGKGTCVFLFGPICQIAKGRYLQGMALMILLFIILSLTIAYPFSLLFTLIPSAMLIYFFILILGTLAIKSWWSVFFTFLFALWFLVLRAYARYVNMDYFYAKCLKNPAIYSLIRQRELDLKPREEFIRARIEKNAKRPLMFKMRLGTLAVIFLVPILFLALWDTHVQKVEDMIDYPKQLKTANQEIKKNPKEYLGYAARALVYQDVQENEKALEDYASAISLKNDDYKLFIERAKIYMDTENYPQAIKDASRALELLEGGGESGFDKYKHQKMGAQFSAEEAKEKAQTTAHRLRGQAYLKTEEYEKAVSDFDELIEDGAAKAEYFLRGVSKYHLKDRDGALEDFNKHKDGLEEMLYDSRGSSRTRLEKALKNVEGWIDKTRQLKADDLD